MVTFNATFSSSDQKVENVTFSSNEMKINADYGKFQKVTERGFDGLSAYEIAVENGFVGSETEWLASLQGADGISPTITTSKSGKVTTLTIKDASGTKTATINDGEDGADGGDGIYLGDEEGIETVPLNADTLGGQSPDYYAKASDVTQMSSVDISDNKNGTCMLTRIGKVVTVSTGSFTTIKNANIPNGYKPINSAYVPCVMFDGSSISLAYIHFGNDGGLFNQTDNQYLINATWLTNDGFPV